MDEKEEGRQKEKTHEDNLEIGIELQNVSARWTKQQETLKEVTLHVKSGELIGIVGPVGSGKVKKIKREIFLKSRKN